MSEEDKFLTVENTFTSDLIKQGDQLWRYRKKPLTIVQLQNAPDSSIEGEKLGAILSWLPKDLADCTMILCAWQSRDNVNLFFWSGTDEVRAPDFLQELCSEGGLVRGDKEKATGYITFANLQVRMEELNQNSLTEYLLYSTNTYFEECDVIHAAEYAADHRRELTALDLYCKKRISWAFLCSTDVAPEGRVLRIKTLENESGVEITADQDTYIMIGKHGEVYQMDKAKFEKTYEASQEKFDLFAQMTLYVPEVCILPEEDYISLDERAHICYPKTEATIYAKSLERRTKIFPIYDPKHYFLGLKGDYLAVRSDDLSDLYIIKRNIFLQTYEPVPVSFH